ncbi:unnamed protein product [Bathycoccus prasinos]
MPHRVLASAGGFMKRFWGGRPGRVFGSGFGGYLLTSNTMRHTNFSYVVSKSSRTQRILRKVFDVIIVASLIHGETAQLCLCVRPRYTHSTVPMLTQMIEKMMHSSQ